MSVLDCLVIPYRADSPSPSRRQVVKRAGNTGETVVHERPASHPFATNRFAAHQPLVVVLAAVAIGVVADRYLPSTIAWWWPAAWVTWFAWWLLWRRGHDRVAVASLLVSLALVGAAWHHACWSVFAADELGLAAAEFGGPAAIEGRVVGAPRRVPAPPYNPLSTFLMPDRTRLELDVTAGRNDDAWQPQSGRVTLSVDGHLDGVRAGDTIRIFGKLSAVRGPTNPGEYDFAARSRGERRLAWLSAEFPECVAVQERGSAWSWRRVVGGCAPAATRWSGAIFRLAELVWPRRCFSVREKSSTPTRRRRFIETGTIHLLVISGLNVGILAACMFFALRTLLVPERVALAAVAIACVLYAATTDAQPPVVRATVMVLVGCAGGDLGTTDARIQLAGRRRAGRAGHQSLRAVSIRHAALVSVGGGAGLAGRPATTAPPRSIRSTRLIARTRPWHERALRRVGAEVWRMTVASAVIWLVISPLVMTRLHLVSPAAVVLGPLLAVPVALAMAAGFGIFALGWLLPPLAVVLGWICDVNLGLMQSAVEFARGWPAGHFWVPGPGDWWLAGFYGALLIGDARADFHSAAAVVRGPDGRLGRAGIGGAAGHAARRRATRLHVLVRRSRRGGRAASCPAVRRCCTTPADWVRRPMPRGPWPGISGRGASRTWTRS